MRVCVWDVVRVVLSFQSQLKIALVCLVWIAMARSVLSAGLSPLPQTLMSCTTAARQGACNPTRKERNSLTNWYKWEAITGLNKKGQGTWNTLKDGQKKV